MERGRIINFATRTRSEPPEAVECAHCGEAIEPIQRSGFWIPGTCTCCEAVEEREGRQRSREEAQEQERQDRLEQRRQSAGLAGRLLEMTFETFDADLQPEAYQVALDFQGRDSLVLHSKGYGTGKTHLAAAILHRWIEEEVGWAYFLHVPSLLRKIRNTFHPGAQETEEHIMGRIERGDLLILDDLGKEKVSEWQEMVLYTLINHRYVHKLPLIITMNLKPEELERQIGSASVSRLLGMARFVEMEGPDYRLRGKRPPSSRGMNDRDGT